MYKLSVVAASVALASVTGLAQAADTTSHGFLEDSKASISSRTMYFNNDNRDGTAAPSKTEEAAQGFVLRYESGFTQGTVGFGLDAQALIGVTLDSGTGRHNGSSMIPSDSGDAADTWSSFMPTAKMKVSKTEFRYGAQQPKLPILVSNDGRLLPQVFSGASVTSKEIDGLTVNGGWLEHVVGRGSTNRTGLSVNGATQDSNKFIYAGADYNVTKELKVQYYFAQMEEFYDQHFLGLVHVLPINDKSSFTTDLRYFRTMSSGENSDSTAGYRTSGYTKDNDGKIDNNTWAAQFTYTYGPHAVTLGHQEVSDGSNFIQPNQGGLTGEGAGGGSFYLYTDRLIQSFTRAGEKTNFGGYTYDFSTIGVPGLKASIVYLKGTDIAVRNASDQKEWERDFSLDYVVQTGTFKNVGFAWRNGKSNSEAARNADQNRLIVNYTLPITF